MKHLQALDESIFVLGTFSGIMERKERWEVMVADVNTSNDVKNKQRIFDLLKRHFEVTIFFKEAVRHDLQGDKLKKSHSLL